MTNTEPTTELWAYMGRRAATDGIRHAWLDPEGETRYFKKVDGSVGGIYEVLVTRDDGITLHGTPKYLKPGEHLDLARWRALDREASTADGARKAAAKLKRDGADIGSMTLAETKAWLNGFRGTRAARMAVILTYLGD